MKYDTLKHDIMDPNSSHVYAQVSSGAGGRTIGLSLQLLPYISVCEYRRLLRDWAFEQACLCLRSSSFILALRVLAHIHIFNCIRLGVVIICYRTYSLVIQNIKL